MIHSMPQMYCLAIMVEQSHMKHAAAAADPACHAMQGLKFFASWLNILTLHLSLRGIHQKMDCHKVGSAAVHLSMDSQSIIALRAV